MPVDSTLFPITSNNVATPSPKMVLARANWVLTDALFGGTQLMRSYEKLFLPKEPRETDDNYKRRVARTTLFNAYKNTVQAATARVYARNILLRDEPVEIKNFSTDVDSQGRNLTQFTKDVFEDSVNHGISAILVDHNRLPEDFPSLEAEQKAGVRPYWVHIQATKILDVQSASFPEGERLSVLRYEEEVTEPLPAGADILSSGLVNTFSYNIHQQIRVFRQLPGGPVTFAIYRQKGTTGVWEQVDAGIISNVRYIPITPVYCNRRGFFQGSPPLQDLGDLNLAHWQKSSDLENILHVVTVPFLFSKLLGDSMDTTGKVNEIEVNPYGATSSQNKDADVRWIEHTGASVNSARASLSELEARMEKLGLELLSPTPGIVSATEQSINAAETNSKLKSMAMSLQDSIDAALYYTSEYLGIAPTARSIVNTSFASEYTTDSTMQNIIDMNTNGIIDNETVIKEAQRRNVLDPMSEIVSPNLPKPAVATIQDGPVPPPSKTGV